MVPGQCFCDDLSNSIQTQGKLEYHVPAQYSKERPPINFTQVKHDILLDQHPLSVTLPRANGNLQIFDPIDPLSNHLGLTENTRLLTDWTLTDQAQLGLHIVTFQDATFVTLTWLHTLLDAMGRSALIRAWTAMLEGREDDVPEFWGYDSDPLAKLGAPIEVLAESGETPKVEEFVLKDKLVQGFTKFTFIFNYIWEMIFYPQEQGRIICIPASHLAKLRAEAIKDLETAPADLITANASNPKDSKPFLSDGDLLIAWTTRLIASANPSLSSLSTSRSILVMNVFGMRGLLSTPSDNYHMLLPKDKAYISNAVSAIFSLFSARDFLTRPFGHIAAQIRKDLSIQGTRAQVEAAQRIARANPQPLYGSGNMAMSAFSNWTRAKLYEIDFSAAIVTETKKSEANHARGKPVFILPEVCAGKGFQLRGSANCAGKDNDGNYWLGVLARKEYGVLLEKEVERLRESS